jgi:uncharacterized membrane protein YbhN (UPF0104 family)
MQTTKTNITFGKIFQWVLKILLSLLALYLVYKKVDKKILIALVHQINWFWLLPALVLFNISKIISAVRLMGLLENIGIQISHPDNLKLYYKSMFYNLFLPGGIGGDAFKTYTLHKGNQVPVKKIIGAVLYDRLSGLIMLVFIATCLAVDVLDHWKMYVALLALLTIPAGYLFTRLLFPSHKRNFTKSQFFSFLVQLSQVLSVICILKALHVQFLAYFNYLLLFLFSSIAAVVPVTVGGAGARELVFLYGKKLMDVSAETGIAIGLIFFLMTSFSSFIGAFIRYKAKV